MATSRAEKGAMGMLVDGSPRPARSSVRPPAMSPSALGEERPGEAAGGDTWRRERPEVWCPEAAGCEVLALPAFQGMAAWR
jgi:hypothetical protein